MTRMGEMRAVLDSCGSECASREGKLLNRGRPGYVIAATAAEHNTLLLFEQILQRKLFENQMSLAAFVHDSDMLVVHLLIL